MSADDEGVKEPEVLGVIEPITEFVAVNIPEIEGSSRFSFAVVVGAIENVLSGETVLSVVEDESGILLPTEDNVMGFVD